MLLASEFSVKFLSWWLLWT